MADNLETARALANQLRFAGDSAMARGGPQVDTVSRVRGLSYQMGVEISPALTPKLAEQLSKVCETLHVPKGALNAFIFPSAEVQASCFAGHSGDCVIHFSSALVGLLDEEEFAFVAGHELGHFLLDHHHLAFTEEQQRSAEYFILRRSQEISVDRVGLVACGSMNTAVRAMMKTASGLSDRHLRFDVGAFLSQLRKVEGTAGSQGMGSTHPSMVVRSRALLWFSMSELFSRRDLTKWATERPQIDKRVQSDLHKFADGALREHIDSLKAEILLWMLAREVVQQGVFSRKAQDQLKPIYGEETVTRLRAFLSDLKPTEAKTTVLARLEEARTRLRQLLPSTHKDELASVEAAFDRIRAAVAP